MAQPNIQGRFFWQELLCTDPAAVTAFYGRVIGWRAAPAASDPSYITFASRSGLVAGAMAAGSEQKASGSHWLAYIGAEDLEATLATAMRLGAKVVQAAADIEQGRYAVLTDPQGASFGIYKPKQAAPEHTAQHGDHCWLELSTTDLEAGFKFYQELFGWQVIQRMDMGAQGTYLIFGVAGTPRGGVMKLSHPAPGPYWLCYSEVSDLDRAIAAAEKSGGRVLHGPMTVPGGARIVQLADPNGAVFALHTQPKMAAIPPKAPATSSPSASPAKPPTSATPAPPPTALPKAPPAKVPTLEPAKAATPKPAAATPAAAPPAPAKAASKPAAKKAAVKKAAAPKKKAAAKKSKPKKKVAAKKKSAARKKVGKKKVAKKATARGRRRAGSAKRGMKRSASRAAKRTGRKSGKARRKK